jgi:hypothetical protein
VKFVHGLTNEATAVAAITALHQQGQHQYASHDQDNKYVLQQHGYLFTQCSLSD